MAGKTIVIAGLSGTGKSYFKQWAEDHHFARKGQILDLDSYPYHWLPDGTENEDFPHNYLQAIGEAYRRLSNAHLPKIKTLKNISGVILVSTHPKTLHYIARFIPYSYVLVPKNKEVVMAGLRLRNSKPEFIDQIDHNYQRYLDEIQHWVDVYYPNLVEVKADQLTRALAYDKLINPLKDFTLEGGL